MPRGTESTTGGLKSRLTRKRAVSDAEVADFGDQPGLPDQELPSDVTDAADGPVGGPALSDADLVVENLSPEDIVDLAHRMIMGRPADPELRTALLAEMAAGVTTPTKAWAGMVGSAEFAQRVKHQRAVIEATHEPFEPGMIDVADLRTAKSIEEHNDAAEGYFGSRDRDNIEEMLAKPFADAHHTPELLTCFGHMVAALRIAPGDVLLDFGAGSGWTSWNFAQLGAEVICCDVAPSALTVAKERFTRWPLSPRRPNPRFLVFDGHLLDLPDNSVDKACCFDAFHHLINQPEVMAEFARVLKPGGLMGFDEPGLHHSKSREAQSEMREFGVVEGDIDLREIAEMAEDAGLEFVAADVLTVRPIWAGLDRFTDLVDYRVPDAQMIQQLGEEIQAKQLFVLRKPGKVDTDSRQRSALGARIQLAAVTLTTRADVMHVALRLDVANTGEARWLAADAPVGGVVIGGRVGQAGLWESRATTNRPLTLQPGETAEVEATFDVPLHLAGQTLSVNLVSERVSWFDICGTPPVWVQLTEDTEVAPAESGSDGDPTRPLTT